MMLKLRADTGARGTNLVQESGPVGGSIEQGLMGKKRKLLLVPDGNKAMSWRSEMGALDYSESTDSCLQNYCCPPFNKLGKCTELGSSS